MQPDSRLIGRERELAELQATLTPGRGAVVVGDPGVGKTALASVTASRVDALGLNPLWVAATPSMQSLPFGVFGWLLTDTPSAPSDEAARVGSVVSALRHHGGRSPTVLFIDDAQLLDARSIDVVAQALAVRAVSVVATAASGALQEGIRRLIDDKFLSHIELNPFDRDGTAALAADLLGGPLSEATTELLWRWTSGMPGLVNDLVHQGKELGRFRLIARRWWWDGPQVVPDQLSDRLNLVFDSLSPAALETVDHLALCETAELGFLERVTSPQGLLELENAGLIRAHQRGDTTMVQFTRDLVAGEWARRLPVLRRRHTAQRLLDVSGPPVTTEELIRVAGWHLEVGPPAPLETLLRASSAVRLSDPGLSQRFADAAHRWHPSVATFVDLLDIHIERQQPAAARTVLEHARSLVTTQAERQRLEDAEVALCLFGDRNPASAREVLSKLQAAQPDQTRATELRSLTGLVELLSAQPSNASRCAGGAGGASGADAAAGSIVALRFGVTDVAILLLAGRTSEALSRGAALLEPAKIASDMMPTAVGMLRAELAFAKLWRAELTSLPTAHPANAHYPSPPLAAAPERGPFEWALMAGIVAHMRADHMQAVSQLHDAAVQQSRGKGIFHAEACAWLIVALCDAGRIQEAAVQMNQFPDRSLAVLPGLRDWAQGVLLAAQGEVHLASQMLLSAAATARDVGAHLIEARYLVEAAERCKVAPIDRLDELAANLDAPLLQRLCRIAVAHSKTDAQSLLTEAEGLCSDGLTQRALSVAKTAAEIARRDGDNQAKKRAAALIRRIRSPHHETSGSTRASSRHSLDLSSREREVAMLASGGLADREIAAQLVVSVRTVESHLANVYRKLGVTSRHELANAVR